MNLKEMSWVREPKGYIIKENYIEITTEPKTDLWQRTYYHFRNDNAPLLQMETDEKFFSFIVKTDFTGSHCRFDQCGIVMYLDSENWLKASVEFENNEYQHLGSVVTNNGYSDWATTVIPADVKTMWYRFSRRNDDYCIECSMDGEKFEQMRVCHMFEGAGKIRFGVYACSPEDSSFKAVFTNLKLTECAWKAHNGQQPETLKLRPHHLLCIQKYTGHGYDEEFTRNMDQIVEAIELNSTGLIELVKGGDQLCSSCPNYVDEECNSPDKVSEMDEKVLQACGLSYGEIDSWFNLAQKAAMIFKGAEFEEICGKCQWNELCRNTK